MLGAITAAELLNQEARALLTRLARVQPFALTATMVPAAAVSPRAQTAIEDYLVRGRRQLRALVRDYVRWLATPEGRAADAATLQRRFTYLRLRFNVVLTQFDIFADVMSQRSEHDNGVSLAGLDIAAADALALPGAPYVPPPVICYLDRGHGAAIRRERTRLPGGGENPVAIVRVPRERMVSCGIASSLVHEVGHQAAALLGLLPSLRPVLVGMRKSGGADALAWRFWERWISEIVADFWSVARVGVTSTLGLLAVVSLPRAFVFRVNPDDPHPFPWIRVKLSCAIGEALFPDPQWRHVSRLWEAFYPTTGLDPARRDLVAMLEASMPGFVALLADHRPRALGGRSLREALGVDARQPARLAALWKAWQSAPAQMRAAPPSLVFAVVGQARLNGGLSPEEESRILTSLLTYWALRSTLRAAALRPAPRARPAATPALQPSLN